MTSLQLFLSDRADDALCLGAVLFFLFLTANLLYAAKSIAGIDLLPGHAGAYFPLGSEICRAMR